MRYVIDYYHDEEREDDELPGLHSRDKIKSITMHVRPALDSPTAAWNRLQFMLLAPTSQPAEDDQQADAPAQVEPLVDLDWRRGLEPHEWTMLRNRVQTKCAEQIQQLGHSSDDQEREAAAQAPTDASA